MTTGTLSDFLRARRAALSPDAAGIATIGRRRVPGLRREEVAHLAGVSITYYTRLEQGEAVNASPSVLDALARALGLDDDERAHLHTLARSDAPAAALEQAAPQPLLDLLAAMPGAAAVLMGPRTEVLAWNRLGHALIGSDLDEAAPTDPDTRPNMTRRLFLDEHTRGLYREWEDEARLAVASLRFVAASRPDDPGLVALVGELSLCSRPFARLWADHPVARCTSGVKAFEHPRAGRFDLRYQVLHTGDGTGQRLVTYVAEPGTAAARALALLAGQAAPGRIAAA